MGTAGTSNNFYFLTSFTGPAMYANLLLERRLIGLWYKLKKRLLLVAGTISTGLGILGIFVPILPTTPFLLLAAACYLRSSERFYRWLINNRVFGAYIRNYMEGRGMPLNVKIFTILLLWLTIGLSASLGTQNLVVRILLVLVAVGVTQHIIRIRERRRH
jgi:uncharacterized membrane protein YbaN (DUF454 family)